MDQNNIQQNKQQQQTNKSFWNITLVYFIIPAYDRSAVTCKDYAAAKGPGTVAKPLNHVFFRSLGPVLKRTLDKCERENGLM